MAMSYGSFNDGYNKALEDLIWEIEHFYKYRIVNDDSLDQIRDMAEKLKKDE